MRMSQLGNAAATVLAMFLGLGPLGCTSPPYQPPRMPQEGAETPPDVDYWKGKFPGAGGLQLFEQGWRPSRPARAVVVFVHGLKDHSSRYRDLGIQLAGRGVGFSTFDMRGHGYSEGVRDHVDSLESAIEDLDAVVARVRDRQPGVPLFLAGQGFGADLVALDAARNKPGIAGLILVAPWLRGEVKRGERVGTRVSAIFGSTTHKLELNLDDWSSDPKVVAGLKNDPLIYEGQPTAATARELLRASDELQQRAPTLQAPVLIIFGGADKVASVEIGRTLHGQIATTDKQLQVYDGLAHDVFHEPQRDQVFSDTLLWINAHAAAAAAAAAKKPEPKTEVPAKAAPPTSQKTEARGAKKLRKAVHRSTR
jgi:acylglycerol lipase